MNRVIDGTSLYSVNWKRFGWILWQNWVYKKLTTCHFHNLCVKLLWIINCRDINSKVEKGKKSEENVQSENLRGIKVCQIYSYEYTNVSDNRYSQPSCIKENSFGKIIYTHIKSNNKHSSLMKNNVKTNKENYARLISMSVANGKKIETTPIYTCTKLEWEFNESFVHRSLWPPARHMWK